jgi:uncharacterized protein (DUF433 family)
MALIAEDQAVQAGAATFRGTRILVHQIAELLAQGRMKQRFARIILG